MRAPQFGLTALPRQRFTTDHQIHFSQFVQNSLSQRLSVCHLSAPRTQTPPDTFGPLSAATVPAISR
jgi:hypothetical protein